jgi:hypothetical protein
VSASVEKTLVSRTTGMIVSVDRRITARAMRIFRRKSESVSRPSFRPFLQDSLIFHSEAANRVCEPTN